MTVDRREFLGMMALLGAAAQAAAQVGDPESLRMGGPRETRDAKILS